MHAAFAADVNTLVPASEAATGLDSGDRSALGGFMELSQAELGQLLESIMWQRAVSHRAPGGRWQVMPAPARNLGTCSKGRSRCGYAVYLE